MNTNPGAMFTMGPTATTSPWTPGAQLRLAQDVPDGWEMRGAIGPDPDPGYEAQEEWDASRDAYSPLGIVECRPPQPGPRADDVDEHGFTQAQTDRIKAIASEAAIGAALGVSVADAEMRLREAQAAFIPRGPR